MAEIKSVSVEPNHAIISELERALEEAKAGRIQGIAVAELNSGGMFSLWFERGNSSILSLLGATEMLKAEVITNGMEWEDD